MILLGKTLSQLLTLIEKKEIKIEEINEYFRQRNHKYHERLNAFLLFNDSLSQSNGRLKGIPIAFKDNFCTKNLRTTASSKVLSDFTPTYSATVVEKIEKAGGQVQGKTNMDAWAHGSSTETSDFKPTKNPWDNTRAPGGSSGGSAAAVSAYLSPAAIGSETAGSIRQPTAWCGTVGLKPTYGRVSRYGVVAMASSFDCPGPITLDVKDAALLLEIIAGKDPYDATSSEIEVPDYSQYLKIPKKYKIGFTDVYLDGVSEEIKNSFEKTKQVLEKLGHRFIKVDLLSPKYSISAYTILQRAEVSSNLARYDGIRYGNDRTFFGAEAKRRIMMGAYTLSHGYYDEYYKKAQKVRALIIADFENAFKDVDIILAPTTPITALKLGEFDKYPFFGEMMDVLNEPAAVAGLPAINFPSGLDKNNLPIGMQLMAPAFKEGDLLNATYQFEQETDYFGVIKKGLNNYAE